MKILSIKFAELSKKGDAIFPMVPPLLLSGIMDLFYFLMYFFPFMITMPRNDLPTRWPAML